MRASSVSAFDMFGITRLDCRPPSHEKVQHDDYNRCYAVEHRNYGEYKFRPPRERCFVDLPGMSRAIV